jgi:hypothetical protein
MKWKKTWKRQGNENLKATIPTGDCGRSKQTEECEIFYLCSLTTSEQDACYTCNQIQHCHGNSSIQQEESFRQQIGIEFRQETNEMLQLGHGFVWCWNLDTSGNRSEIIWKLWNVVLEKEVKDQSDRSYERWKCIKCSQGGKVCPSCNQTKER